MDPLFLSFYIYLNCKFDKYCTNEYRSYKILWVKFRPNMKKVRTLESGTVVDRVCKRDRKMWKREGGSA